MKRTIVPFGPQHPVLPEPLVLDLLLEDEKVVDAIPTIGYIHRGLEAMVDRVEFTEMGFVVERICGICSFMHGMGYCVALESIMSVEVPDRARWLRIIWAEISRIQSHLLWLGLGADAFGFENLFMHCWRMREVRQAIDLVHQMVDKMPKGEGLPLENKPRGNPSGETFTRLEQPRGEVVYYVKANGTKYLERFRARTPTFANIPAMIKLVKGCDLADVPNIILTIDPCISCTER